MKFKNKTTGVVYTVDSTSTLTFFTNNSEFVLLEDKKSNKNSKKKNEEVENIEETVENTDPVDEETIPTEEN